MTNAIRKKVITIETREKIVVRQIPNQTQTLWCQFCQAEVEMTAPELAATILRLKVREIYRRIEHGEFHFFETETGEVFICKSLLKPKQSGDK